ncbi:hypothetical protein ACIGHN_11590 [Acidovorax sp. NPDC077693]|uniref:hypothetical protein n=1 Tax=unclassified Acidovorax TaxID=2684926 RepID=UPI0037C5888A
MTVIRERLTQVAERFKEIEVALFSTFTFNADFFEQNALAALFKCQPDDKRTVREARIHKELSSTRVAVFYDALLLTPSKHRFRYSALPVYQGPNRLFHPKNIILIGKDSNGEQWVYIAAMSANLTLSGWGKNLEGFADAWIHAKSEQPAKELTQYLEWLQANRKRPSDVLKAALDAMDGLRAQRALTDPEGGPPQAKQDVRVYFSPLHSSLWSFLKQQYGSLTSVVAGSPYWGDSSRAATELRDVRIELIAARCPPHFKAVGLGKSTVAQLYGCADPDPAVCAWQGQHGRFHHLKFYKIQTTRGQFMGLGSSNFTDRGQFWSETQGNVESMMFDQSNLKQPATVDLPTDGLPEESTSEDAPTPLPAYVSVQYDWHDGTFRWQTDGTSKAFPITLRLPNGGGPFTLTADACSGSRKGALEARTFTFTLQESEPIEGLVEEVNVQESTLLYARPLPVRDILQSWQNRSAAEPPPPDEDDPGSQVNEDGEGGAEDPVDEQQVIKPEDKESAFDWFLFYRVVRDMQGRLQRASGDSRQLAELAVTRSDSVIALAESMADESVPSVRQWLVVKECIGLLRPFYDRVPHLKNKLKRLKRREDELKTLVERDLAAEASTRTARTRSPEMLAWYTHQLSKAGAQ